MSETSYTPGPWFVGPDDAREGCPAHSGSGLAVVDTGREMDLRPLVRARPMSDVPGGPDLSRESFEAWLRSKEPGAVVGSAAYRCGQCPIATWLTEAAGAEVLVGRYTCGIGERFNWALPMWAHRFIVAADERRRESETAADCLAILAGIQEGGANG